MTQSDFPAFSAIDDVLQQTKLKSHPSQAHGLICGLLSGNPTAAPRWQELVLGADGSETPPEELKQLHEVTAYQLKEFLFDFNLLLPDDDVPLPERAEAMTLWCGGFLTGLKLANVPLVDREPSEITEAINDMIEIAKMDHEAVVANEEDEVAYTELVEFVRMAVMTIYQDLREAEAPPPKSGSGRHAH